MKRAIVKILDELAWIPNEDSMGIGMYFIKNNQEESMITALRREWGFGLNIDTVLGPRKKYGQEQWKFSKDQTLSMSSHGTGEFRGDHTATEDELIELHSWLESHMPTFRAIQAKDRKRWKENGGNDEPKIGNAQRLIKIFEGLLNSDHASTYRIDSPGQALTISIIKDQDMYRLSVDCLRGYDLEPASQEWLVPLGARYLDVAIIRTQNGSAHPLPEQEEKLLAFLDGLLPDLLRLKQGDQEKKN